MAISPGIAAAVVILGASAHRDTSLDPTCSIQMHDGRSSAGLECIIRPIHQVSEAYAWTVMLISLSVVGLIIGAIVLWDKISLKKYYKRQEEIDRAFAKEQEQRAFEETLKYIKKNNKKDKK